MNLKYSKQREAIKEYLEHTHEHPTADNVYENIKKIYPNISLGTVYRNLSLLADIGEIKKISTPNGPDRFDADKKPHFHFTCTKCGYIEDIYTNEFKKSIIDQLKQGINGSIDGQEINFYGLCQNCMKDNKN